MNKKILYPSIGVLALAAVIFSVWQAPAKNAHVTTSNTPQEITATVTIAPSETSISSYEVRLQKGENGFVALQKVANQHAIEIKTTTYDFGELVSSINGMGEDTSEGKYWSFYVNDVLSDGGASAYEVVSGDRMTWKYQAL